MTSLKKTGHKNITIEDTIEVKSFVIFLLKVVNIELKKKSLELKMTKTCLSSTTPMSEKEK